MSSRECKSYLHGKKNMKPNSSLPVRAEKRLISFSSGILASFFLPGQHLLTGAAVMGTPVFNGLGGKEHPPPL